MTHLAEEQLILAHYGEGDARDRAHLLACEPCARLLDGLARDLSPIAEEDVPEPAPGFEDRIWARLQPRLAPPRVLPFRPRPWMGWAAAAAALALAFLAGRQSAREAAAPAAAAQSAEGVRERVLLVAVGEHLERSAVLLVELKNAAPDGGAVDLGGARASARTLLAANRLYRQSAGRAGDPAVEDLLGELERVLAEVAHVPDEAGAAEVAHIRRRIEKRELLFKVRVLGTRVREQEKSGLLAEEAL
jgi:hypothetical protein